MFSTGLRSRTSSSSRPCTSVSTDVVEDAEGRFEGFAHVDDWVPQRLVTATGPNPLPR